MSNYQKEVLYRQLMWDYDISPNKIDKLLSGEIENIKHYNRKTLFIKMIESFPWFSILQLLDILTIKKLLTKELINKLRTPALRKKYFYVRKRLQEIVPVSG